MRRVETAAERTKKAAGKAVAEAKTVKRRVREHGGI
jgi:hypothetical protein